MKHFNPDHSVLPFLKGQRVNRYILVKEPTGVLKLIFLSVQKIQSYICINNIATGMFSLLKGIIFLSEWTALHYHRKVWDIVIFFQIIIKLWLKYSFRVHGKYLKRAYIQLRIRIYWELQATIFTCIPHYVTCLLYTSDAADE